LYEIGEIPDCIKQVLYTIVLAIKKLKINNLISQPFIMPGLLLMTELSEISGFLISQGLNLKGNEE
jgi:hypothetical protein